MTTTGPMGRPAGRPTGRPTGRPGGRRRPWGRWVLLLLLLVPLAEIYVLIQVGQAIGAWWTIVLLVADSLFGAWLIKREGGRAWRELRTALEKGRMPASEIADGALILIGGTLMLAPGFVTDAFGILLILPFTRPLFRGLLAGAVARRLLVTGMPGAPGANSTTTPPRTDPGSGQVIQGEVVDD